MKYHTVIYHRCVHVFCCMISIVSSIIIWLILYRILSQFFKIRFLFEDWAQRIQRCLEVGFQARCNSAKVSTRCSCAAFVQTMTFVSSGDCRCSDTYVCLYVFAGFELLCLSLSHCCASKPSMPWFVCVQIAWVGVHEICWICWYAQPTRWQFSKISVGAMSVL